MWLQRYESLGDISGRFQSFTEELFAKIWRMDTKAAKIHHR